MVNRKVKASTTSSSRMLGPMHSMLSMGPRMREDDVVTPLQSYTAAAP
jgi:hypothetical protein